MKKLTPNCRLVRLIILLIIVVIKAEQIQADDYVPPALPVVDSWKNDKIIKEDSNSVIKFKAGNQIIEYDKINGYLKLIDGKNGQAWATRACSEIELSFENESGTTEHISVNTNQLKFIGSAKNDISDEKLGKGEELKIELTDKAGKLVKIVLGLRSFGSVSFLIMDCKLTNLSPRPMHVDAITPIHITSGEEHIKLGDRPDKWGWLIAGTRAINMREYYELLKIPAGGYASFNSNGTQYTVWGNEAGGEMAFAGFTSKRMMNYDLSLQTHSLIPNNTEFKASCKPYRYLLAAGETIDSDEFLIGKVSKAYPALVEFAKLRMRHLDIKLRSSKPLVIWSSWYWDYWNISEDIILENAKSLAEHRNVWPVDVVHIDYGWFKDMGDWEANDKFPHGMKWIADQIKALGFKPGLWYRPGMARVTSEMAKGDPNVFVKGENGKPFVIPYENAYRVNFDDPSVQPWFEKLTNKFINDWGFEYLKCEFLSAPKLWPGYRKMAGNKVWLQDNAGGWPALGYCDSERTDNDPGHKWLMQTGDLGFFYGYPGIEETVRTHILRFHENGIYYWIDPSNITLYPDNIPFGKSDDELKKYGVHSEIIKEKVESLEMARREARFHAAVAGLGGGMIKFSGNFTKVKPTDENYLSVICPSYGKAAEVVDLLTTPAPVFLNLKVERPFGKWNVAAVLNWHQNARQYELDAQALGLDKEKAYHVFDFWNWKYLGQLKGKMLLPEIKPHDNLILSVHEVTDGLQFISSSAHITQGGVEIDNLNIKDSRMSGRIIRPGEHKTRLAVAVPQGKKVKCMIGEKDCFVEKMSDTVVQITIDYKDTADFEIIEF